VISLDHTQTHTTVGRTPLDERSARRRDLYLTTQTLYKTNIHAPDGIRNHDPQHALGRRPTPYTARPLGSDHRSTRHQMVYRNPGPPPPPSLTFKCNRRPTVFYCSPNYGRYIYCVLLLCCHQCTFRIVHAITSPLLFCLQRGMF
jgi:hypothetical protein